MHWPLSCQEDENFLMKVQLQIFIAMLYQGELEFSI